MRQEVPYAVGELDDAWAEVEASLRGRPYPGTDHDGGWSLVIYGYPPEHMYGPPPEEQYHATAKPVIDSHYMNGITAKGASPAAALRALAAKLMENP